MTARMAAIAVIPARGGSKRIPRKNLIDFCGKPMIAWTIGAAIESGIFGRVLVSTDDPEIAAVSRDYGAEVPFLREHGGDHLSHVSTATLHTLDQAQAHYGEEYSTIVQLMANCPLRNASDIQVAARHFESGSTDSQLSCFEYGFMNPWWANTVDESFRPMPLFPRAVQARSQDLPKLYCPTGAIWIARVASLKAVGSFYGLPYSFCPMSWISAVDIDDEQDLKLARALFRMRQDKDEVKFAP